MNCDLNNNVTNSLTSVLLCFIEYIKSEKTENYGHWGL